MKKHPFTKMSSEEIQNYFAQQFDMYYKASQRAYNLMLRNENNFVIKIRAEYIWLHLNGKMDVTAKFKHLGYDL